MMRWVLLACVLLGACSETGGRGDTRPAEALAADNESMVGAEAAAVASPLADADLARWARSCALCHVRGEGGAPRIGDGNEWRQRLEKGESTLLIHTIEGYNNMPPLGYCMDCEREDLHRLIRFMSAGS
jgi:cytochrome c5